MSETNVKLQPKDVVDWLRHAADDFGEDGEIDKQDRLHTMADNLTHLFDAEIYGSYKNTEAAQSSAQTGDGLPDDWATALPRTQDKEGY